MWKTDGPDLPIHKRNASVRSNCKGNQFSHDELCQFRRTDVFHLRTYGSSWPVVINCSEPVTSYYFSVFLKVRYFSYNPKCSMPDASFCSSFLLISFIHNSVRTVTVTIGYISLISVTELIHASANKAK